MPPQRYLKRSLLEMNSLDNVSNECSNAPYKRRKQTSQALEALGQLIRDGSFDDDLDMDKFNKNDILSLTLSKLLRHKYWPSTQRNLNVQLAAGVRTLSSEDNVTGFLVVMNTNGRIITISDNAEHYLRKNVRLLYPQLASIYDCVSPNDYQGIREILNNPTSHERRAICNWILPRGRRPNRSHTETKSMLLTGHFFFPDYEMNKEPLFVARCEQILSSTPNIPSSSAGSANSTVLQFVLDDQLNISEISPNTELVLGFKGSELVNQSIYRIVPTDCLGILQQAKQTRLSEEHCTSVNVLDLYTRDGDCLTFLCNTHTLLEGRRRTMKLGFFAQLIDPAMRNECLIYANKQNFERQMASAEQKTAYLTNIILNNSTKTNRSISPKAACFTVQDPAKHKRQRLDYQCSENENPIRIEQSHKIQPVSFERNCMASFFTPATQPVNQMDDLFNWLEEEKYKPRCNLAFNDGHDAFAGNNNMQDFVLYSPSLAELSFFA